MVIERIRCDFRGQEGFARVFHGQPASGYSKLHFQAAWLWQERGGRVLEGTTLDSAPWVEAGDRPVPNSQESCDSHESER